MAITTPQGFDLQAPEPLELKKVQADIAARDGISLVTRYEGLKVYVVDTQGNYQLRGGTTNAHWVVDNLDTNLFYTKINLQTSGEAEVHWDNLTNTPASYLPSAHTHVEADIINLQNYLLNINSESIGDLADVNITSPSDNQLLRYSAGSWVNYTPPATTVEWGNITGSLPNQLDLMNYFNSKENTFLKNSAFNKNLGTIAGTVSEGDHTHYIISVPESSAVATSTGLELNNVKYGNFIPQTTPVAHQEGLIYYDKNSDTFRAYNDITDVALDIGQELWGRVDNDNAHNLPNGKVGYVKGASINGDLLCDLADSSDLGQSERTLGLFTNDIAPGNAGYITRYGVVRDMDTSAWSMGDLLYLDAHNPGELTNERPIAPHYPVRIGVVMYSDSLIGAVGVDTLSFTGSDTSVASDGVIDGVVIYTPDIAITVAGGIIYADVIREDDPTHNLPFLLNGVRYALNTTTNTGPGGAARIVIPPGASATETQASRLYIKLNAGVPELAITTSAISEPYANLASFTVFNAVRTLADGQPFMYRRANNAISSEDIGIDGSFGLLTVVANAIRFKLGSNWLFGQDATTTVNDTTIRTTLSTGLGAQLHVVNLPAFDGLTYLIYNTVANAITYEESSNLTDIVTDAVGNTLLSNNTFYTIRLFYHLNSNGVGNNIIATRPIGSYSTSAEAIQDPLNYTIQVADTDIEETVYPIYDLVIGRTGAGGTTIALVQLTDLRSKLAGQGGGGGATGGGTDDKVRVSGADTVNDYLDAKIATSGGISTAIINPGSAEQLEISVTGITTVGTNGDYATISAAITAGKYNLRLVSDITETANVTLGTVTDIDAGIYSINMSTYSFTVTGDAINLNNLRMPAGTITINATADKTTIIGCRTASSIVDNGTNTTLLANNLT